MTADSDHIHVPKRTLESNTLEDNILIKLYQPIQNRLPNIKTKTPIILIEAPETQFNQTLNKITYNRQIQITTTKITFQKIKLTMILNPEKTNIETLVVNHINQPIEIHNTSTRTTNAPTTKKNSSTGSEAVPPTPTPAPATATTSNHPNSTSNKKIEFTFYKLTIYNQIHIIQTQTNNLITTIDKNQIESIFTLKNKKFQNTFITAPPTINRQYLSTSNLLTT